ncbi:MAG: type II toxin-antitoxin system ParD family antitoxin, partial [Verrucomicrobiota bacterium]
PELRTSIDRRLRSGLYGNASDVVRAGLRALWREEMAVAYQEWRKIAATLPREPITPEIESRIERMIRAKRQARNQRQA